MLAVTLDAQRLDTCLTFRTFFPTGLRTFVTTYMDVFRREEFHDFSKYIFDELQHVIITCTKYIVRYTPLSPYFVRATGTTEFRISVQSSLHVSRKVDFRDDSNVLVSCISDDFLDLFLSIETFVRNTIVLA